MRDLLITCIVFGTIPIILRRPWTGILVFAWLSYMSPHRMAHGFAYDMPFAAIVAATTIVASVFSRERRVFPVTFVVVVWLLWVAWMNLTTIYAIAAEPAIEEWSRTMKIQLMTLMTILLLQDRRRIDMFIWTVVISIGFYGVKGGIFAIATGGSYRVWGPPDTFFWGTNPLALTLLMTLPLMLYLFWQSERKIIRVFLAVSMILCAFAIVSTYSRGAFVAGAAVSAYVFFKSGRKLMLAPFMIAALASVLTFMPAQYFDRISTITTHQEDESAMGRVNAWKVAYGVAKERPLVGGGFQMITPEVFERHLPGETLHDTHSIYFEALGEQGFVGLLLFLLLMWGAMRQAKRLIKSLKTNEDFQWALDLASMIQVSIVAYAVGGAFLGLAYFDFYYHLIALLLLLRIVVDRALQRQIVSEGASGSQTEISEDGGRWANSGLDKINPRSINR